MLAPVPFSKVAPLPSRGTPFALLMSFLATLRLLAARLTGTKSPPSRTYWETRYSRGGSSGPGSYGELARWKAEALNRFVAEEGVESVVEFGCGDGHQLALADYPRYTGVDVAPTAVARCRALFGSDPSRRFEVFAPSNGEAPPPSLHADLALSLDVLYHLVEGETFEQYLRNLFASAERFVIIYSSNEPILNPSLHVKHRAFTPWVEANAEGWKLRERIENPHAGRKDLGRGAPFDFYVYERVTEASARRLGEGEAPAVGSEASAKASA